MISKIYEKNLLYYLQSDDSKYADVALRIGSFLKDGIGVEEDIKLAYLYFLRARTAIKIRINSIDYVGDIGLANSINKSIFALKKELKYGDRLINEEYNGYILKNYENDVGERSAFEVEVRLENDRCFKFSIKPRKELNQFKYIDIILDSYSFSERVDELEFVVKTKEDIADKDIKVLEKNNVVKMDVDGENIIFTVKYGRKMKIIIFDINEIIYIPKSIKDIHKNYHVVSVVFNQGGKLYDYLDGKKTASIGDKVMIETKDGTLKEVEVVDTKDVYEDELSLPLNKMSSIK